MQLKLSATILISMICMLGWVGSVSIAQRHAWPSCEGQSDRHHAEPDTECTWYYTCLKEQVMDRHPCPAGLVFSKELQVCDWQENVAPPCGTAEDQPNKNDNNDDNSNSICSGQSEGAVVEWGCRSYTQCVGGDPRIINCRYGEAYHAQLKTCLPQMQVPQPCGNWTIDCSGLEDGRYAELSYACTYFYTCHGQQHMGTQPCPGGLVFNKELQVCDWQENVAPPCGTAEDQPNKNDNNDDNSNSICSGQSEGAVVEWGCRSYTQCVGGDPRSINCRFGEAYHAQLKTCLPQMQVPQPCGNWTIDCSRLEDGRYAELSFACTYFYSCHGQQHMGTQPCPGGLVFNEELQVCDWRENVAPPCGTAEETTAPADGALVVEVELEVQ